MRASSQNNVYLKKMRIPQLSMYNFGPQVLKNENLGCRGIRILTWRTFKNHFGEGKIDGDEIGR